MPGETCKIPVSISAKPCSSNHALIALTIALRAVKNGLMSTRRAVDHALDAFERATRLDPDFFDAHVNRAFAWQRKGKHGHAVIAADRALKIREAPWLWTVKGLSHLALLESSLAARCFELLR